MLNFLGENYVFLGANRKEAEFDFHVLTPV